MLIPYDNDVIVIDKKCIRSFEDDAADAAQYCEHDEPEIDLELYPIPEHTVELEQEPLQEERSDDTPDEQLRFISPQISPVDRDLALQQDASFNQYFYGRSRTMNPHIPRVVKPTSITVWRNDPLKNDPYPNPLASIIDSLKTPVDKKEETNSRRLPIIPVPETILPDNPQNVLRHREISCWDFENGVLSMELPPLAVPADGEPPPPKFSWVLHGQFDVQRGAENLREFFAREWRRDPAWRVHIQLHDRKYKPGQVTVYVYETIWSIPTRRQPVPPATASIFFNMSVCTRKRLEAPVIVTCHFENNPMILDPLQIKFGADILLDIMERKQILADKLIY